jgi:hypothetical protein
MGEREGRVGGQGREEHQNPKQAQSAQREGRVERSWIPGSGRGGQAQAQG